MASNATKFGTVALGAGITGAIIALLTTNSLVLRGNQVFDPTSNATPKTQIVDTTNTAVIDLVSYSTSAVTYARPINFTTNGYQSGAGLQVNGLTRGLRVPITCASTGASTVIGGYYPTCIARSPYNSTGTLLDISLECGSVPQPFTGSAGFLKVRTAPVGTALRNFAAVASKTGALVARFGTGASIWNPADFLKFQASNAIRSTSGLDCKMILVVDDKYGS
jgi:hypothetical protein